jgi:hypothetical protein
VDLIGAASGRLPGTLSKQLPIPRQEFVDPVNWVLGDAGQDVGQPGLRVDVVHFGRDDDAVHGGGALSAAIGTGEQPRLTSERNLAVILPISGRMSSSIIAGIHYTGGACVVFRASGAHRVMSCT